MFVSMTSKAQTKSPAELDPDTRARIEDAMLRIFSRREFHKVGMADIAREARVSLQTLYKYYGSKETLLFSGLDSWLGHLTSRMMDHLQGIQTYKDRLRKVFWVVLDYFESNPRVAQVMTTSVYVSAWRNEPSFRQPQLMSVFLRVLAEGRDQGVLTDEVDEKTLLDFIYGFGSRVIGMWMHRGMREPLADRADVLFEMVWRAIARPGQ